MSAAPVHVLPASARHEALREACASGNLILLKQLLGCPHAHSGEGPLNEFRFPFVCDTNTFRELLRLAVERKHVHVLEFFLQLLKPLRTDRGCYVSWASLGLRELHASWLPAYLLSADVVGLDLSDNHLTTLSASILSLFPYLLSLDLACNALQTLPSDEEWCASGFPFLSELHVDFNQLTVLPTYLFQLATLRTLSASHNLLQLLPLDSKWFESALTHVDLSHNRLKSLPNILFRIPTLEVLNVAYNVLTELPTAASWNLPALTTLNLSSNPITDLPAISGLQTPRLLTFSLSRTLLHALPYSLVSLPALKSLDLSYCMNMIHLPPALFNLSTLVNLNIRGLTLPDIPRRLAAGSKPAELLGFLRSRHVESDTYDMVNVVIMGGPLTGKSSLDTALVGKKATGPMRLWQHRPPRTLLGPRVQTLTFRTWDLGGEYLTTAVRCALRQQSLYLVTWSLIDGHAGIDALSPLLLDIHALNPTSAVIIVATHCDQHAAVMRARGKGPADIKEAVDAFKATLRHRYVRTGFPRVSAMIEIGSQNGTNISLLKDLIYAAAVDVGGAYGRSGLDHPIPRSAAALIRYLYSFTEECLSGLKAPVMTMAELRRLRASANSLMDVPAADLSHCVRLLELHNVLVRLPGPTEEDDYLCLDHQWLVAAMTDATRLASRGTPQGMVTLSLVPPTLGGVQCPPHFHPYLFAHLEANQLCLSVRPNTWLAPGSLPDMHLSFPSFLTPSALQRVYRRRYLLHTIPADLWCVLLSELLACVTSFHAISLLPKEARIPVPYCGCAHIHPISDAVLSNPALTLWSRGIAYGTGPAAGFVVQQLPPSLGHVGLDVCVVSPPTPADPDNSAAVLLGHVCNHIEHALGRSYPGWTVTPQPTGASKTETDTAGAEMGARAGVGPASGAGQGQVTGGSVRMRTRTVIPGDRTSGFLDLIVTDITGNAAPDGSTGRVHAKDTTLIGRCELPCICGRRSESDPEGAHYISLEQCLIAAETCQSVACPLPTTATSLPARVRLDFLAPDTVLCCDAEIHVTSLVNCGEDRIEAVLFGRLDDGDRVQLMPRRSARSARLDFAILASIKCPLLLPPLGLHLTPPSLVYPLPPVGTLHELLVKVRAVGLCVPLPLCCRIIRQVCEGLSYLHAMNIVHGALSPATVGVWSLCTHATVNIKLLPAPSPLPHRPAAAAAGFVAPEILRGNFTPRGSDKADVFAAGMVLWTVLALEPPLARLSHPSLIHAAIAAGRRPAPDDLVEVGAREPLVELLKDMWHARPAVRPSAAHAAARLSSPLFRFLRHSVRLTKDNRLECGAAVPGAVWLCSGDQHSSQITALAVGQTGVPPSVCAGFGVAHSRILCACVVGNFVWVGTQAGDIFEFSIAEPSSHYSRRTHMKDSVLGLIYSPAHTRVYACLASGSVAMFAVASASRESVTAAQLSATADDAMQFEALAELEGDSDERFDMVDVVARHARLPLRIVPLRLGGAATAMVLVGDTVWVGSMSTISVLNADTLERIAAWYTTDICESDAEDLPRFAAHARLGLVQRLVLSPAGIWSVVRRDTRLCLWDDEEHVCLRVIDFALLIPRSIGVESPVVSNVVALEHTLWVSLKTPCVLVLCPPHPPPRRAASVDDAVVFCACSGDDFQLPPGPLVLPHVASGATDSVGGMPESTEVTAPASPAAARGSVHLHAAAAAAVPASPAQGPTAAAATACVEVVRIADLQAHMVVLPCTNDAFTLLAVRDGLGATCVLAGGDAAPPPAAVCRAAADAVDSLLAALAPTGLEPGTLCVWDGAARCCIAD